MKTHEARAAGVAPQRATEPDARRSPTEAPAQRAPVQSGIDQSVRVVAQRQQVRAAFGPAAQQRQAGTAAVVQRQVNSNIASLAAMTPGNWLALLRTNRLSSYMRSHTPSIVSGQGGQGDTFVLVWYGAIQFGDGTVGDLHVHMHEGVLDPMLLAGGGAWVDGGAPGHGQNVQHVGGIERACVKQINEAYDENYQVG